MTITRYGFKNYGNYGIKALGEGKLIAKNRIGMEAACAMAAKEEQAIISSASMNDCIPAHTLTRITPCHLYTSTHIPILIQVSPSFGTLRNGHLRTHLPTCLFPSRNLVLSIVGTVLTSISVSLGHLDTAIQRILQI